MSILGFELAAPALGLGVLLGLNYALLAVGIVLVYRNSKLVNFAHGEIGVGAAVVLWIVVDRGVPYWLALPATLVLGGLLAAGLERSVVERLRDTPRAIAALATLGAGQFILYVAAILTGAVKDAPFPEPPGIPSIEVGTLIVHPSQVLALVLGPLAITTLVVFMTKTSWGLALRGAAADMDLARASGFVAGRLSALTWALSGALATLSAVLLFGLQESAPPTGLDLLLAALTAGVIARMTSLPLAALAGLGLGILQHLLLWNGIGGGFLSVALFCLIFIAVSLSGRRTVDVDKQTRWSPIWPSRHLHIAKLGVAVTPVATATVGAALLLVVRPTDAATLTIVFGFALLALSAAVITGLSGELVLGQTGYAGIGGMVSIAVTVRTGDFFVGFSLAAIAGGLAALISSLPALRRRDLSLAVLSLAFAFACVSWAFHQTWMYGGGIDPGRPIIGSFSFTSARSYAALALAVLCLGLLFGDVLWRSPLSRRLVAQRDNPAAAMTFGISAPLVRAQGLFICGAIAGLAGAILVHGSLNVDANSFRVGEGLRALGAAALGGIATLSGGLWGSLFMVALPAFVGGILRTLFASWTGWLLVIVTIPAGLVQAVTARSRRSVGQGIDDPVVTMRSTEDRTLPSIFVVHPERTPIQASLALDRVSVSSGDLTILNDVSVQVHAGDIVGLVGRNGAGKSTLLDIISGQRAPDSGHVRLDDEDITRLLPERRARIGIARSFEGAILFPTLTVLEATVLALENAATPTKIPRRSRRAEAMSVIAWVGLERIATKRFSELSTGLRRMAQLACLCARRPRLLLLDEPASGVAQAEIEGLGSVLGTVNAELGTTILVVEHDLRVVRSLATRVVILDAGRVVAEGPPEEVLRPRPAQG